MNEHWSNTSGFDGGRIVRALVVLEVEPGVFMQVPLRAHEVTVDQSREEYGVHSFGSPDPIRSVHTTPTKWRIEIEGYPAGDVVYQWDTPAWATAQPEIDQRRALPSGPSTPPISLDRE